MSATDEEFKVNLGGKEINVLLYTHPNNNNNKRRAFETGCNFMLFMNLCDILQISSQPKKMGETKSQFLRDAVLGHPYINPNKSNHLQFL